MSAFQKIFRPLVILMGSLLLLLGAGRVLAAVDLKSFDVTPQDGQVQLDWETGTEFEFAGFFVLRNAQDDGDYLNWSSIELLDTENGGTFTFIPGRNDFGAEYHFADQNVQNGTTYCYVLEAVNVDSSLEFFPEDGALCVVAGLPTPTPTVTSGPTSTPTTAGPTATLANSPTPGPTRTPRPTFTGTIIPTETPTPTLTPTVTQTPTETPLPTFLPTLTLTRTPRPTRTATSTITATSGPLLESTLQAGGRSGIAGLADRADLTLREIIVSLVVGLGLAGGLGFLMVYVFVLRNGGQS